MIKAENLTSAVKSKRGRKSIPGDSNQGSKRRANDEAEAEEQWLKSRRKDAAEREQR